MLLSSASYSSRVCLVGCLVGVPLTFAVALHLAPLVRLPLCLLLCLRCGWWLADGHWVAHPPGRQPQHVAPAAAPGLQAAQRRRLRRPLRPRRALLARLAVLLQQQPLDAPHLVQQQGAGREGKALQEARLALVRVTGLVPWHGGVARLLALQHAQLRRQPP